MLVFCCFIHVSSTLIKSPRLVTIVCKICWLSPFPPTHQRLIGLTTSFYWNLSREYAQVICFGRFIQIVFPLTGGWTSIWARGT